MCTNAWQSICTCSSVDRAVASEAMCRGFESLQVRVDETGYLYEVICFFRIKTIDRTMCGA